MASVSVSVSVPTPSSDVIVAPTAAITAAEEQSNFAPVVSPQLVGSLLAFFFLGTLMVQVYAYRSRFRKDSFGFKLLAYFTFLIVLVATILLAIDTSFWFAISFGQIDKFSDPRNSRLYAPILGSAVSLIVQAYFAAHGVATGRRVAAGRRGRALAWFMGVAIAVFAMASTAGGMGAGIISYMEHTSALAPADKRVKLRVVFVYMWLAAGAVADSLIAISMIYYWFKSSPASKGSDWLEKLVQLFLESNLFSALASVAAFVLYVAAHSTTYFICPVLVMSGIQANSLLAALHSRPLPVLANAERSAFSATDDDDFFETKRPNKREGRQWVGAR